VAEFERSPDLRQRVYDEAAVKGQQTQARTVTPGLTLSPRKSEVSSRPPASIFISELRKSARSRPGGAPADPRVIEEKLSLIFWKRDAGGGFVGCVVADDEFRARLVGRCPRSSRRPASSPSSTNPGAAAHALGGR